MTPLDSSLLEDDLDVPEPPPLDDVTTTGDEDSTDTSAAKPPSALKLGFIIDEKDDKKVARHIDKLVEEQEAERARNMATWKRNAWWREGKRFVRLEKKENQSIWEAKLPAGMGNAPPVPNKTDRLCRRTVNVLMVDPPYPECEPGSSGPEARDAAEFSTRYLEVRGAATELDMTRLCRRAMGKAMTYASAFAWVIMDPKGGGHRPRQVLAHPDAPTQDTAVLDPETQAPAPEEELVQRYVAPDGTLTDNPQEADLQWLPGEKVRLLTGKNVVLLPPTAASLREAQGVVVIDYTSLGDLRDQFEDQINALTEDQLDDLCRWKPRGWKEILPPYTAEPEDQKDETTGEWMDSQVVWTETVYYRRGNYPKGCYAIKAGKETMLYRDTWTAMVEQPPADDGTEQPEKEIVLRIPLSQCRCLDDDNYDNPMGKGMAEQLGPADEIRASSLGYELEYMFRFGNPIQFLPMGTIVQPKQLQARDGNPIYFNPQGTPVTEEVPALPAVVPALRAEMADEMNDESGLQETGQGVESKDVHSGVHARTVVQEALKAISNMKDNLEAFYIDLNTVILEQSRAFCSVPTLLSYTGKDGEYKEKEWSRSDFGTTHQVSIKRGSFTMHTLTAKQELANDAFDRKIISQEEYQELVAGGVSPILGYQENPHLMRVRRQIDVFNDGPQPGWMEAVQANQEGQQQATAWQQRQQANGAIGLAPDPVNDPQPVVPPLPPGPFDNQLPIDDVPEAAKIRFRQLTFAMAASKYEAHPPEWQQTLEKEWQKAKNASGIMTVPEVQQVQAQQQADAKAQAIASRVTTSMKVDPTNVASAEEQIEKGATAAAAGQTPDVPVTTQAATPGTPGNPSPGATHFHVHFGDPAGVAPAAVSQPLVPPIDADNPPQ